ncbi:NERD domain-containing protein [Neobacillus notoginsengisoli]|uniref:NERD domain-containing protein n=1 Tax=Neobacillus notoginsengisoli TaxID=1578198 RepID=A0A417YRX2_9BACI|nr:nuclease-related domain-containing protein [Neobacillus notoginsengisoli]RHW38047.1 NERD domain-containing protein [Neobacillus notoginsengisoli]
MVVLERMVPLVILMLDALLRRINHNHPKRKEIEEAYRTHKAGYNGEKSVDYYMNFLDEGKFQIFKGIRLPNKEFHFQIDTLIITPFFAIILEIKNWGGEIYFDKDFCQVYQEKDGKTNTYQNPVSQAILQKMHLKEWLRRNKFPDLPIEFLVVMSNTSSRLKSDPGYYEVFQKVLHSIRLLEKIAQIEKKYKQEVISENVMKKLKKTLLKKNTPLRPDILKNFEISPTAIIPGIQCPTCHTYSMKLYYGKSRCQTCKTISKTAPFLAITDYFLLCANTLTNQDIKSFLKTTTSSQTYFLLQKMNLQITGTNKGRVYSLPLDYDFEKNTSQNSITAYSKQD